MTPKLSHWGFMVAIQKNRCTDDESHTALAHRIIQHTQSQSAHLTSLQVRVKTFVFICPNRFKGLCESKYNYRMLFNSNKIKAVLNKTDKTVLSWAALLLCILNLLFFKLFAVCSSTLCSFLSGCLHFISLCCVNLPPQDYKWLIYDWCNDKALFNLEMQP